MNFHLIPYGSQRKIVEKLSFPQIVRLSQTSSLTKELFEGAWSEIFKQKNNEFIDARIHFNSQLLITYEFQGYALLDELQVQSLTNERRNQIFDNLIIIHRAYDNLVKRIAELKKERL